MNISVPTSGMERRLITGFVHSVKLKGDNLRGFISNWDQVMAGIPKVPEVSILETLFFNQVKNSKAIAHDLQEYHRAEERSDKKTYMIS